MAPPTGPVSGKQRNKTREPDKRLEQQHDNNGEIDLGAGIVDKGNREGIERHRDALRTIVKKVQSVKTQIEQAKLESGVAVDELTKWSDGVEAQQETADEEITYLSETLVQINYKTSLQAKKCEEELAERDRDKQLQFERPQLEQKLEFEKKI